MFEKAVQVGAWQKGMIQVWETDAVSEAASVWMLRANISRLRSFLSLRSRSYGPNAAHGDQDGHEQQPPLRQRGNSR